MPIPIAEVVKLGASEQHPTTKAVGWQCINPITGDDDFEDFGLVDVLQTLGITSAPWPADDSGFAEGLVLRNAGNRNALIVGARDTRTAGALGTVRPGDTVLHSTGPEQAAQVQCKESKRQVVAYTKDTDGQGMVVMLDGKNNKVQVLARGAVLEILDNGDCRFLNKSGTGFIFQGSDIIPVGTLHLPGMPPGMVLMCGPPTGSPGSVASVPMFAVLGVGS